MFFFRHLWYVPSLSLLGHCSPLSSLFLPSFASSRRLSRYSVLISLGSEVIFHSFLSLLTFPVSTITHIVPSLLPPYFLSISSPLPPIIYSPPSPSPLSRSVRYCLKSWAAVWWLKRWQIDTFTHDRTLADRAQGERGSDEGRESASEGEGQKNNKLTTRRPLFPQAEMDGSERMSVCFFSASVLLYSPSFSASLGFKECVNSIVSNDA